MEINSIILDDGREYFVLDSIVIDNITYTLFSDIVDEKEIRIRKINIINNKEFYVGLDSQEEFKKVILAFDKKNNS